MDFIVVIHEFPQDRIEALASNPFTMTMGNEVTVRMQKQTLQAIPSDESPCKDEGGYSFQYCELTKVRHEQRLQQSRAKDLRKIIKR